VERLKGTGIVTTGRGKRIAVEYQLCFAQDAAGLTLNDQMTGGANGFSGQVWCRHDSSFVCVHSGQTMTLSLEDGRRLRFTHRSRDGEITVTEWLG